MAGMKSCNTHLISLNIVTDARAGVSGGEHLRAECPAERHVVEDCSFKRSLKFRTYSQYRLDFLNAPEVKYERET